jgi:hypothetical protein
VDQVAAVAVDIMAAAAVEVIVLEVVLLAAAAAAAVLVLTLLVVLVLKVLIIPMVRSPSLILEDLLFWWPRIPDLIAKAQPSH